jgi:hypothetical protein
VGPVHVLQTQNCMRMKRRKNDDDTTDDDEKRSSSKNSNSKKKQQRRPRATDTKRQGKTKNHADQKLHNTYRDRAKERREGVSKPEDGLLLSETDEKGHVIVSASDVRFDAVIDEFETQYLGGRSSSNRQTEPNVGRIWFQNADQALRWIDGGMPEVPPPKSETAKSIVEVLKTKHILATPQHLSLHRAYYTFGTQWNPWWERPVMNTFFDSNHSEKQPWTSLSEELLTQVAKSCQMISNGEAEKRQNASSFSIQNLGQVNEVDETSDDDIFSGAGNYDASVAIQQTAAKQDNSTFCGGGSIFDVVCRRHMEPKPENASESAGNERKSVAMGPLRGFSEGLNDACGVDMDYEVTDTDPKKKQTKRRRTKGGNDSD